ncbi:unnamed protein product [Macrosiphum euphorbiae]|uniref:Uncharacterized protein n=1 Tax=Macrosiphum euphorbiae TaxID=13131 RepID=A0AAV0WKR3_9HEMI|nr:unnamed protein product [Macrosiphum euphorbiae]CAI6374750.1 unnamed protein product [Macrosiphum euphorbiae]CAI6374819.1 unnamed protein product [Macrosiphum euphorbiae]
MPFVSSLNSTDEETMILSDNDSNNESMDNEVKPVKKPSKQSKNKKENISYLDNIESLLKNEKIETDIINTITVKQGDNLINVKSPTDDKISEYWTMSHYKVKNIKNVDSKNRWKEAECSLKVTITDEEKDQELKNNLSEVVQTIFTRFMSDPKRKIIRSKLSKN